MCENKPQSIIPKTRKTQLSISKAKEQGFYVVCKIISLCGFAVLQNL